MLNKEIILTLGFIPESKDELISFLVDSAREIKKMNSLFDFKYAEYSIQDGLVVYYGSKLKALTYSNNKFKIESKLKKNEKK